MLPYNVLLWIDKQAGAGNKGEERKRTSTVRWLRLAVGGLTVLAGLATLFVMAMIYRPIAESNMAGVFTVASFFAAPLALGGVMTAMWLGPLSPLTPPPSKTPPHF